MWIQYPETLTPELPIVWGIRPENLHRYDPEATAILQLVLAHHPDHYDVFVAVIAAQSVWGKRLPLLLKDIFLDNYQFYNPHDFFGLLIPDALKDRIEEFSKDKEWKNDWNDIEL